MWRGPVESGAAYHVLRPEGLILQGSIDAVNKPKDRVSRVQDTSGFSSELSYSCASVPLCI